MNTLLLEWSDLADHISAIVLLDYVDASDVLKVGFIYLFSNRIYNTFTCTLHDCIWMLGPARVLGLHLLKFSQM